MNERLARIEARMREIDSKAEPIPHLKKTVVPRESLPPMMVSRGVSLSCKNLDDFAEQAQGAETIAFQVRGTNEFNVSAVKDNVVYRFSGDFPSLSILVKAWLRDKLSVKEDRIVEGSL